LSTKGAAKIFDITGFVADMTAEAIPPEKINRLLALKPQATTFKSNGKYNSLHNPAK
jgi:hypothetical protein